MILRYQQAWCCAVHSVRLKLASCQFSYAVAFSDLLGDARLPARNLLKRSASLYRSWTRACTEILTCLFGGCPDFFSENQHMTHILWLAPSDRRLLAHLQVPDHPPHGLGFSFSKIIASTPYQTTSRRAQEGGPQGPGSLVLTRLVPDHVFLDCNRRLVR